MADWAATGAAFVVLLAGCSDAGPQHAHQPLLVRWEQLTYEAVGSGDVPLGRVDVSLQHDGSFYRLEARDARGPVMWSVDARTGRALHLEWDGGFEAPWGADALMAGDPIALEWALAPDDPPLYHRPAMVADVVGLQWIILGLAPRDDAISIVEVSTDAGGWAVEASAPCQQWCEAGSVGWTVRYEGRTGFLPDRVHFALQDGRSLTFDALARTTGPPLDLATLPPPIPQADAERCGPSPCDGAAWRSPLSPEALLRAASMSPAIEGWRAQHSDAQLQVLTVVQDRNDPLDPLQVLPLRGGVFMVDGRGERGSWAAYGPLPAPGVPPVFTPPVSLVPEAGEHRTDDLPEPPGDYVSAATALQGAVDVGFDASDLEAVLLWLHGPPFFPFETPRSQWILWFAEDGSAWFNHSAAEPAALAWRFAGE